MRAIFHADLKWGIGRANDLMFSLPKDMKFFRETTAGKVVVLGLNTLRSFPGGRPLKNRTHILLSPEEVDGVINVHSLDELLQAVRQYPPEDVFVIGGASVYRALMPYCTEVLVTRVQEDGHADVFVPDLDRHPDFTLTYQSEPVEDNGHIIRFCSYRNTRVLPYSM